ncbi:MAG: CoA-transferase [Pseudomonadota bacterium]
MTDLALSTELTRRRPSTVDALVRKVADGAKVAFPPDYSGCAMTAVRGLIAKGVADLHVVGVPSGGLQVDWLIGAGCVSIVEMAAMTLGEFGVPPRFAAAQKARSIIVRDGTCPAIHAGLQAAEKGIPFLPLRGILGSDLLKHRDDWQVVQNPMSDTDDPIVIVPAIAPDVALFHAAKVDRNGNVWIGVRRELMLMAHAAKTTLVTAEEQVDTDFLADPALAAGTIPSLYITDFALAPRGAAPVGLTGAYPADRAALADYVSAAQTHAGFDRWFATAPAHAPA